MTNAQAIKLIKSAQAEVEWEYPMDYAAAFDLAIKALEQADVPDTNVGELISRQAAIDILDDFACDYETGKWDNAHSEARGRMINLPSVKPERKTGKWFLLDECANEGWYCDQCHKKVFKADFSNTMRKYKFCPNCGSRMEVETDDRS